MQIPSCQSAGYKVHSFTELLAEGPWFKVAGLDKVFGEGKHGSVDLFCNDAVQIFLKECLDVKKDKWKLFDPHFIGRGRCWGLLRVEVKALNHVVWAGVLGSPPDSLRAQKNHQSGPEFRLKLGTLVAQLTVAWMPKREIQVLKKVLGIVTKVMLQIGVALDVDMLEPFVRYGKRLKGIFGVPLDLVPLAFDV